MFLFFFFFNQRISFVIVKQLRTSSVISCITYNLHLNANFYEAHYDFGEEKITCTISILLKYKKYYGTFLLKKENTECRVLLVNE